MDRHAGSREVFVLDRFIVLALICFVAKKTGVNIGNEHINFKTCYNNIIILNIPNLFTLSIGMIYAYHPMSGFLKQLSKLWSTTEKVCVIIISLANDMDVSLRNLWIPETSWPVHVHHISVYAHGYIYCSSRAPISAKNMRIRLFATRCSQNQSRGTLQLAHKKTRVHVITGKLARFQESVVLVVREDSVIYIVNDIILIKAMQCAKTSAAMCSLSRGWFC